MEYFDVYDEKGYYLNKVVSRGTRLKEGEFFLVVHVWIENDEGKFLIQKRAKKSDPIPHQWAITSGIPNSGEKPLDAALRETREELGAELDKSKLKKRAQIVSAHGKYNTITHVYHTYQNIALENLELDKREVCDVKYARLDEILSMVESGDFWNYSKLLGVEDYFDMLRKEDWHANPLYR